MGSRMPHGSSDAVQGMRVTALVQTALHHMRERRLDEAAQTWSEVLQAAPEHPQALLHLGQHKLYRKDALGARRLLERAASADPKKPGHTAQPRVHLSRSRR